MAKSQKKQRKKDKVPREGRERKTQLFQPTQDPTANMHCDERQEEKGVVEGSHITHVIMGEKKGKETERPRRKKKYQKSGVIQISGKCFHRKCTERDGVGDVSRCRGRNLSCFISSWITSLGTGSLNWSKTSRHIPSSGVA
jgi:hypothetical protein